MKTYSLRTELPEPIPKLSRRARAVFDVLRDGRPRDVREILEAIGKYTPRGIGAALSELRKKGLLSE